MSLSLWDGEQEQRCRLGVAPDPSWGRRERQELFLAPAKKITVQVRTLLLPNKQPQVCEVHLNAPFIECHDSVVGTWNRVKTA